MIIEWQFKYSYDIFFIISKIFFKLELILLNYIVLIYFVEFYNIN